MTATLEDLSQAVMTWLDQRPPGSAPELPSPTWSTRELRDSFRANLGATLRAAIKMNEQVEVITQLVNAFRAPVTTGAVELHRWKLAPYEGPKPQTFDVMRAEIAELLHEVAGNASSISGYPPSELADSIVGALESALSDEAERSPEPGITPEAILHYYMIPAGVKRKYNVRTFLFFFGLVILSALIYAVIKPDSWLNPATGLFVILGYATLIATSIAHGRSHARI